MKPVSKTAFYCCGVRMQDAERADPVCNDTYAKLFMNETGSAFFEKFKDETRPNSSNVARHRIIDDLLRAELAHHPLQQIILVGAGFDSRAYRLDGGRWAEFDAPELIIYKNERLPVADCPNELVRIPIDFESQALRDELVGFGTAHPVVIVIEGVLLYLDAPTILGLLRDLVGIFPNHKIICDLMTRKMFEQYARTMQEKLAGEQTALKVTEDDPAALFAKVGYRHEAKISIPEMMGTFRMPGRMPGLVLKTFFRVLYTGYTVNVFEIGPFVTGASR